MNLLVDHFRCTIGPLLVGLRIVWALGFICTAKFALAETLNPKVESYLKTYCLECHGEKSTKSDFRIDKLSAKVGFENTPQWLEIIERINAGEMPPKDAEAAAHC